MAAIKVFVFVLLNIFGSYFVSGDDFVCAEKNGSCRECLNYIGCVWCYDENTDVARCVNRNISNSCSSLLQDREDINVYDVTETIKDTNKVIKAEVRLGRFSLALEHSGVTKNKKYIIIKNQDIEATVKHNGDSKAELEVTIEKCSGEKDQLVAIMDSEKSLSIEVLLKLQCDLPCDCESKLASGFFSRRCSERGMFQCGRCQCKPNWGGTTCDQCVEQTSQRGDLDADGCKLLPEDVEVCSGRGRCFCRECECNKDVLFPNQLCQDICEFTNECAKCHIMSQTNNKNPRTYCKDSCHTLNFITVYNNVSLFESDAFIYNKVFNPDNLITCPVVDDYNCTHNYTAIQVNRTSAEVILQHNEQCGVILGIVTAGPNLVWLPIVLAIILLSVIAGSAFAYWRHVQSAKGIPSTLDYTSIDADLSKGENPIYKPPSIRYNNPTYGKC